MPRGSNSERKASMKIYNREHKEDRRKWNREHRKPHNLNNERVKRLLEKAECFAHFGWRCECCGEERFEFLTVDHIGGGGHKHKSERHPRSIYTWLVRNKFPPGFRLLCWNCNCSIGQYGYCPHEN